MPKINVKHLVYNNGTKKGVIGGAVRADFVPTIDKARFYNDGALTEVENIFVEGALTLEVSDLLDTVEADLLGHTMTENEMKANVTDEAPEPGVGFYRENRKNKVSTFTAVYFPRSIFDEPSDSNSTHTQNRNYGTTTLNATVLPPKDGSDWRNKETFPTEAEAITYLDGLAGIEPEPEPEPDPEP